MPPSDLNAVSIPKWSQTDTLRFKGLGILMIVLHNFFHLVRDLPRENEFFFSHERAEAFRQMLLDTPTDSLRVVSSFLGHFGVQIFIFLSAYGLTRKFMTQPPGWGTFMLSRYRKIYPVFALAAALWLFKITVFSGLGAAAQRLFSMDLLYVVLNVANIIPGQALRPVGPWWFLSFIFQFYAVYPFLFRFSQKAGDKGLLGLSVLGIAATIIFHAPLYRVSGINLYYTVAAHLPEVCLGMHLARRRNAVAHPVLITAIAGVVFVLGCVYPGWWHLNHISALILLIALDRWLRRISIAAFQRVLVFYGAISMPLFLVNAYLREPLLTYARQEMRTGIVICYAVLFLLIATLAASAISIGPQLVRQWTSRVIRKKPPVRQ